MLISAKARHFRMKLHYLSCAEGGCSLREQPAVAVIEFISVLSIRRQDAVSARTVCGGIPIAGIGNRGDMLSGVAVAVAVLGAVKTVYPTIDRLTRNIWVAVR